jgi:hypothetical protein
LFAGLCHALSGLLEVVTGCLLLFRTAGFGRLTALLAGFGRI